MKLKLIPAAHELISNMRTFFQVGDAKLNYLNEEPLREELFSSDQMERFGKTLATRHRLSARLAKDHLLKRLADNEITLQEVRKLLTDSIKRKYQVTPAGEWLIDNFCRQWNRPIKTGIKRGRHYSIVGTRIRQVESKSRPHQRVCTRRKRNGRQYTHAAI